MYNLITIGDIVIDTHVNIDDASLECQIKNRPCQLCLDYGTKIPIKDSFQSLGGNAANVAAASAKLGLKTQIISSIGNDSNGRIAIEELKKFNVDTTNILQEKRKQTRYSVILNFQSERTILSYHGKRKYSLPSKIQPTELLYYTGLSEGYEKLQQNLIKWSKKHPTTTIVFNPGSYQIKKTIGEVREMIHYTDILILNLQEAEKITGTTLKEVKSVTALMRKLLNMGVKEVAITNASEGAYVADSKENWHLKAFPVKVVAKVGAGDAFSAGYISARHKGYNRPQSLRWGIANSSGVITKQGAQNGLLSINQIKEMLNKYENIKPILIK